MVTVSPGAGKSAVLGALVSAAHPQLTEQAAHIRERLPGACRPAFHEQLTAVQARQRALPDVLAALARQLHLPKTADRWTTDTFMDALRVLPEPPVLVVDALDEAIDPSHVTQGLLLPPLDVLVQREGAAALLAVVLPCPAAPAARPVSAPGQITWIRTTFLMTWGYCRPGACAQACIPPC
ncbi:hypothetical protein [Streptomyces tauricus]|uniref:hypothetical protein n=1 Tax=Streptomyces tauricus TaxID=68274 RepID=UPI003412594B